MSNASDPVAGLYDEIGEEALRRFVRAFYEQVPGDDVLGPMYPEQDLPGAEERLYGFLAYRFGGPPSYVEERGHPRLRQRHARFAIGLAARDRWVACMTVALEDADIGDDAKRRMMRFLGETATFLINRSGTGL